jgi:hypothetical protein
MPFRYDPKHWRDRAEEMRRLAHGARNEGARQMMLRIADDYDQLAFGTRPASSGSGLHPAGDDGQPDDQKRGQ